MLLDGPYFPSELMNIGNYKEGIRQAKWMRPLTRQGERLVTALKSLVWVAETPQRQG